MIYSVWNQPARKFDYFETTQQQLGANTPSPKHISASNMGVPIDHAGWPLPPGARKVGSGDQAKGRVASNPRAPRAGLGAIPVNTATIGLIGLGLAAFFLWKSGFART
jgi:hypothetical protein